MAISPARKAAFDILLKIDSGNAHSSALLEEFAAGLDSSDRGLCHEITLGVLRYRIYLDRLISVYSARKAEALDKEIKICLQMGLYQIRFLDRVPDFAVVNDSVSLAVRARKRSAKGFVNAVLRKSLRERLEPRYESEEEAVCVRHSHPAWLFRRWKDAFGAEEAARILEMNNLPRPSVLRHTAKFDRSPEELRKSVVEILSEVSEPSLIVPGAYRLKESSCKVRNLVSEGLACFQDEGSQIVGGAFGDVRGMYVLDVCAAPGNKTSMIARSAYPGSGLIVASDRRSRRMDVLRDNLDRQGAEFVKLVGLDAESDLPFEDRTFDRILVDAPCTGTGTIPANPEIRYRISPDDIFDLSRKQLKILVNASKALKQGGRLIYSTCSLETEENEEVIARFLSENDEFQPAEIEFGIGRKGDNGTVRLLPHLHGTEGFFIAALERAG